MRHLPELGCHRCLPKVCRFTRLPLAIAFFVCAAVCLHSQVLCGQGEPVSINNGAYKIRNNEFDSSAPECISISRTGFAVTQSALPWKKRPAAYPFIYVGCHWGNCTSNTNLPVQVNKLRNARSDWNTTQPTSGAYDAAYDLWFSTTPTASARPDGAELMIWLNRRGGVQPAGSLVSGNVSIGAATYQVWFKRSKDRNYIAYVAANTTLSVSDLDLLAFIHDAARRGYINSSWFLLSIEAGFELWEGGTGLATNSFAATVNDDLGAAPFNVRSPADGEIVSRDRIFNARLENIPLDSYQMFWNVDGGQFNRMRDCNSGDHKEALVDFSSWNWRDAGNTYGPFLVTFTAENSSGTIVRQRTITIYVAK